MAATQTATNSGIKLLPPNLVVILGNPTGAQPNAVIKFYTYTVLINKTYNVQYNIAAEFLGYLLSRPNP